MSKENKELSSEETKKVEGGIGHPITIYYYCKNDGCKREWTSNDANIKKCKYCGSTNIGKR